MYCPIKVYDNCRELRAMSCNALKERSKIIAKLLVSTVYNLYRAKAQSSHPQPIKSRMLFSEKRECKVRIIHVLHLEGT
jgi:hypothetical protein